MTIHSLRALAVAAVLSLGAGPAIAQSDAGAYLAARSAATSHDFAVASDWFITALGNDPDNAALMENALAALLALGDLDRALPIAKRLSDDGVESQLANMALQQDAATRGDWDAIFDMLEAGLAVGPLVDGLTRAWARVGRGEMDKALSAFDEVIETPGLKSFGLYHKALALAAAGDFESADEILSLPPEDGLLPTRRGTIAHAQILSQLNRNDDALALFGDDDGAGLDPGLEQLRDSLAAGDTLAWDFIGDARAGLAEVYFSVAGALLTEAPEAYVLLYARTALALDPDHVEAVLLTAELLDTLGRYDLAGEAYGRIKPGDPAHPMAELGRADVLRKAGETTRAIEVLELLGRSNPDLPAVQVTLGDIRRISGQHAEAVTAYTKAIEMAPEAASWWLYYARGIARHRLDDWTGAEADLRAALKIEPNQSQVLNFLGYSLVERGEKLDEALGMIESAVMAQPQNGAIVDSLGWVQFTLGQYEDAVTSLERAAALEPVDPVVNDHLGDALWAVDRRIEARFQWQRALSFDPEAEDATRIRRKLEVGLDAVLADEGRDPLNRVAETK